jgi:uncharacterized protein (DUF2062 family)
MPRETLKKLARQTQQVRDRWYARPFDRLLGDARLWSLQRRSVTLAFGAGLAICFVPLPVHVPLALLLAMLLRANLPTLVATTFLVNPFTALPAYFMAYSVGCMLLGTPPGQFQLELSWQWLQTGLGPLWQPLLVGCLSCAVIFGIGGALVLDRIWLWRVREKYRSRYPRSKN